MLVGDQHATQWVNNDATIADATGQTSNVCIFSSRYPFCVLNAIFVANQAMICGNCDTNRAAKGQFATNQTDQTDKSMIFSLFRKETEQEKSANLLYEAIVAQARQPVFYIDYQVEDNVTGRFELIVLHAYMLFHRLKDEDQRAKDLSQAVFDRFFEDMDHSLREIGIGDLSVPKKIKKMAQLFYGNVKAYDKSRETGDEAFAEALSRNIYPSSEGTHEKAGALVLYVKACTEALTDQTVEQFAQGKIHFSDIPALVSEA